MWTCIFVSACVWRPEGNVGCNALRRHSFCCLRQGLSPSWNSLIWLGSWPVSSRDPFLRLPMSGITSIPSCFPFLCVFWELDWCHYAYTADVSHDWGVSPALCVILSFLLSCVCIWAHVCICFHVCECTGVGRCVLKPEVDVSRLLWSLPPLSAKAGPGNWTQSSLIQQVQRGSWPLYLPLSLPPACHTCPAFHSGSGNPIFAPHTFLVGGRLISRATVQFPTSVLTAILQVFVAAYVFWG